MPFTDKYQAELRWWVREAADVIVPWYRGQRLGAWGHRLPNPPATNYPTDWENAIATLARAQANYYCDRLFLSSGRTCGKILDAGCGPLLPARHLPHDELWCLDPLLEGYALAGFPVFDTPAVLLPYYAEKLWVVPDNYFDTIVSVNALDHVDDFAAAIAELERVAKPSALIRLELTYHGATPTEPIELNDIVVREAFRRFPMKKIHADMDAFGFVYALWSNNYALNC